MMKKSINGNLLFLGHEKGRHGLENLVLTGRIEGRRARECQ